LGSAVSFTSCVPDLPSGTVTFLFTDVEGSTRLLRSLGAEEYAQALADHRRVLRDAFARHRGVEVDTQGDSFFVAFATAPAALAAAHDAQRALAAGPIRVRMGVHTGTPLVTDEGYVGADVHRAARIAAAGHGGQVLVSRATRELLADVHGVSFRDLGEHRLKDLTSSQRLFQLVADGLETEFPALTSLGARPTNLPVQATPLVGRERELADVGELLGQNRLVTLTGPGGIGKTRLALQAAADSADGYAGGTYFVALEATRDPALLTEAIASTVGVRGRPELPAGEALAERLAEEPVLLVLDNFEHLLDAATALSPLFRRCETLTALTTSREPLRLEGEQEYPVGALSEDEAIALFRERARAVRPDFQLTAGNEAQVRAICSRVDRLPLALELAAARVKVLPPSDLLARLERRLPVLTGGARDRPSRQQTLRGTIEWSYELLDERERTQFAHLAVFAGGWSLDAAERVCDAELDVLASLVDKSLVVQSDGPGGEARYGMLETIREYAVEQLRQRPEVDELRRRHAEYFAEATSDPMVQALRGGGRTMLAFQQLDADIENIRLALEWAIETGSEHELRLATLYQLSPHIGPAEGRRVLAAALARHPARTVTRARALSAAGGLARTQGDFHAARPLFEEALALYREADDAAGTLEALMRLATVSVDAGDVDGAEALLLEGEAVARQEDDLRLLSIVSGFRATMPALRGDLDGAREQLQGVLSLRRRIGDEEGVAAAKRTLAFFGLVQGQASEALLPELAEALRYWCEAHYPTGIAMTMLDLAAALAGSGAVEAGVRIYAAARRFERARGYGGTGPFEGLSERAHARVRRAAQDPSYAATVAAGEAMTLEEAAEYALEAARRVHEGEPA
jgi:predicted ATPase/class 3 adenylate cyclase